MVHVYQYSLHGISEDGNLNQNRSENLRSCRYKLIFINVFLTGVHESQMTKFFKVAVDILGSLESNLLSAFGIQNFKVATIYLENLRTLGLHYVLQIQ
jgi:hypothetical protein